MSLLPIDDALLERLYRRARAERWNLPAGVLAAALQASVDRALAGKAASSRDIERYLESLHLEDLALACACAAGDEAAWDHFVREQRPVLYRAADLIDRSGGAREIADALYAELYGLQGTGNRQSLFRYFHGRSSLATWLRAVLAQRHVDRVRTERRFEQLPDEGSLAGARSAAQPPDPARPRYLALIEGTLGRAVSRLDAQDRLRLSCYYAQGLTLAQIGGLLREHEATVSRHLGRIRGALRRDIERQLRVDEGLSESEIAECFASVVGDPGSMDVGEIFGVDREGKESAAGRSR